MRIPKEAILHSSILIDFFIHLLLNKQLTLKAIFNNIPKKKKKEHEAQMNSKNFYSGSDDPVSY